MAAKNKELQEKIKVLEEKISEDEKHSHKQKVFIILMIIIIFLGILLGSFAIITYFYRDVAPFNEFYSDIVKHKKQIQIEAMNEDEEFIEEYHNSAYRLNLESAYGDNQGTHPKVIYFDEEWNGYKYWMVFSPYPYSDDSKENPHIKVSNDLINWTEPEGFTNPLEDTPEDYEYQVTYNSDPHLVYVDDTDTLECYFRKVDDANDAMILYRMTTQDGINWTEKEEILRTVRSEKDYVSPAIIYEDGIYKMWFVDKNNTVKYEESYDGYTYENTKVIELNYDPSSLKTWHLDVIHTDVGYEMITVAYECWEGRTTMKLYYFHSDDNEDWSDTGVVIMEPSHISWDNWGMYRSSFIKIDDTYYVYYSGRGKGWTNGIGLSYGTDIENLIGSRVRQEVE